MKRILFIGLSLFLTLSVSAQSGKEINPNGENDEILSSFNDRKEKGFYSTMYSGLMFGANYFTNNPNYYYYSTRTDIIPSFTTTFGYIINKHWTVGAGVGFEIINYNRYPLFAEIRYTLWDDNISPFVVINGGYCFADLRAKQYNILYMNFSPYVIEDAFFRNYGGFMFYPELGVKVPLNENSDLLFSVAYRYVKSKSVTRKEYIDDQFDEWEHNEANSQLSFGIGIMFR